jgi:hypothetical protein
MKKLILVFILSTLMVFATDPSHFTFTSTNKVMTLKIDGSTELTFGSGALDNGDEIGVFTQDGVCVGAVVWEEAQVFFSVYGETSTPPVDGLEEGESMVYKVWDSSEEMEHDSVDVTHSDFMGNPINDEFDTSVPFKEIATFFAFRLDTPVLSSPTNNATAQSLSTQLSWEAVDDALTYNVKLSANSDMSSPLVDASEISNSSYTVSGGTLSNLTQYYWQVQAVRGDHVSSWSDVWSYTTTDQEDKFVNLTMAYNGYAKSTGHVIFPVMIELRSGDELMQSTVVTQRAALLNSDGEAELNLYDIDDGDYWLVVRGGGYMPIAIPQQQSLSADGITWDFTTSSSQSVAGTSVMIYSNGEWQIRPGDFDASRSVAAFDVNYLIPNLGNSAANQIP